MKYCYIQAVGCSAYKLIYAVRVLTAREKNNCETGLLDPMETNLSEILIEIYTSSFIQENSFENVARKMAAILSRPQCVNFIEVVWQIITDNSWGSH